MVKTTDEDRPSMFRLGKQALALTFIFSLAAIGIGCPARVVKEDPKVVYTRALGFCEKAHRDNPPLRKPLYYLGFISEKIEQWQKAIDARKRFVAKYQTHALQNYLEVATRKIEAGYDKNGLGWARDMLANRKAIVRRAKWGRKELGSIGWASKGLKKLDREDVSDITLLEMYLHIARDYNMLKKEEDADRFYMGTFAFAEEMARHGISTREGTLPIVRANAEARFYLSERRRRIFDAMNLQKDPQKHKARLKEILALGVSLSKDYARVVELRVPGWALAAAFRQAEIYVLLARKVNRIEKPATRSDADWKKYTAELRSLEVAWREKAILGFETVLGKATSLEVYNKWVERCEDTYRKTRKALKNNAAFPYWWRKLQQLKDQHKLTPPSTFPSQVLEVCKSF